MTRREGKAAPIGIRWTARALDDLVAIGDYITCDNPAAARRQVEKLLAAAESAARFPLSGRVVPELGQTNIREKVLGNYRLVYRIRAATIEVLTVFEAHRLLHPGEERDG